MSENQEIKSSDENQEEIIPSVTMVDILEQEKQLEEESAAVLGGSDEKCCTYSQGYIKRQALYSCLTCCPEAKTDVTKSCGICLACSYQCHENHELIELYTKRNFRCDCSTDRIIGKKCNFVNTVISAGTSASNINDKDGKYIENNKNDYNQNFTGVYCICHRPYPDPEDPIQDEMIQCIGCEDWFHTRHLDINTAAPQPTEYSEMICGQCMEKYNFLQDYVGFAVQKIESTSNAALNESFNSDITVNESESVTINKDDKLKSDLDKSISDIMNMTENNEKPVENNIKESENNVKVSENNFKELEDNVKSDDNVKESQENVKESEDCKEPSAKKIKIEESINNDDKCKRPTLVNDYKKGAIFWSNDWRKMLCTCLKCSQLYDDKKASFLLDPEDTVLFYEENGMKKVRESDYERGIRALSSMGHTQQIDAITEYNHMKEKLKEYLHTFVVNKKVVTEEDINTFFQGMKNEKNNTNSGQQPHYCR